MSRLTDTALANLEASHAAIENDYRPTCESVNYGNGCPGATYHSTAFWRDAVASVPAMLAPGEVVLPNVGGKSPSDLLGNLGNLSRDLSTVIARSQSPGAQGGQAQAPMFGEIHIHANDADSVRHAVSLA